MLGIELTLYGLFVPWLLFLILVLLPVEVLAGKNIGHVQVKSDPGVWITFDGVQRGLTEGKDGMTIRNVSSGAHRIIAYLDGFRTQQGVVMVEVGEIAVFELNAWQPLLSTERRVKLKQGSKGTGSLVVQALPVNASISSNKLGWKKIWKKQKPWVASEVPAGVHKLTFCSAYKCIDHRARIEKGGVLSLFIDFDPGVVVDRSKKDRARWSRWRKQCKKDNVTSCARACEIDSQLAPQEASPACRALRIEPPRVAEVDQGPAIQASSKGVTPPCAAKQGKRPGYLTIMTTPPSTLFLGERSLGKTPLAHVRVPSGCVELRALAGKKQKEHRLRIEVESESVAIYKVDL